MKTRRAIAAALEIFGTLALAFGPARAADSARAEQFTFRYPAGQPASYAMRMKMKLGIDVKSATESMSMKMAIDLRYQMKLTAAAEPAAGVSALRLEPSGLEGDWDITGPGGHIVIALRGSQMTGTHDGTVVINTAQGVGEEQAQALKKEIMPLYLSGGVDLDQRGSVRAFHGDPPFVEFWTDAMSSQVGMWGIVFPEKTVAVGDTWQETLVLKKMGQINLEGDGLRCDVTFERKPDVVAQRQRLAEFSLSAPFSHRNLAGSIDQMGQVMPVNLARFDRRASGLLHFDRDRGVVTDAALQADATGSMTVGSQDQAASMELAVEMDLQVKLLPPDVLTGADARPAPAVAGL